MHFICMLCPKEAAESILSMMTMHFITAKIYFLQGGWRSGCGVLLLVQKLLRHKLNWYICNEY